MKMPGAGVLNDSLARFTLRIPLGTLAIRVCILFVCFV